MCQQTTKQGYRCTLILPVFSSIRGGNVNPDWGLENIESYCKKNLQWKKLQLVSPVIDLAKGYHTFTHKLYPSTIQIAKRFHVNRHMTVALQIVRKKIQNELCTFACHRLKIQFPLLGKRANQLSEIEAKLVNHFFQYADLLHVVYKMERIVFYSVHL